MRIHHICLFDKSCWREWYEYGMPLRIYWKHDKKSRVPDGFITIIPGYPRRWEPVGETRRPDPLGRLNGREES